MHETTLDRDGPLLRLKPWTAQTAAPSLSPATWTFLQHALQSGVSRELFEAWCEDPRNCVIIADFAVQVGLLCLVSCSEALASSQAACAQLHGAAGLEERSREPA